MSNKSRFAYDDDSYTYDGFAGDVDGSPAEIQLEKLRRHLMDFGYQLRDIESALDASLATAHSEDWAPKGLLSGRATAPFDLISIDSFSSAAGSVPMDECLSIFLNTGNLTVDKVLWTLSGLQKEVLDLQTLAHENLFPALGLIDELLQNAATSPHTSFASDSTAAPLPEAVTLPTIFSRIIGTLQRVWSFKGRCQDVAQNMMSQLQGLFHTSDLAFKNIIDKSKSHFSSVFASLGFVLTLLVELDLLLVHLVPSDPSFDDGRVTLPQALLAFKKMLRTVRQTPDKFGSDAEQIGRTERALEVLEADLLAPNTSVFARVLEPGFFMKSQSKAFMDSFGTALTRLASSFVAADPNAVYSSASSFNPVLLNWPLSQYVHDRVPALTSLLVVYVYMNGGKDDDDARKTLKAVWDCVTNISMKNVSVPSFCLSLASAFPFFSALIPAIPVVPLCPSNAVLFFPIRFVKRYLPNVFKAVVSTPFEEKEEDLLIRQSVSLMDQHLDKVVHSAFLEHAKMLIRLDRDTLLSKDLSIVTECISFCNVLSHVFRTITGLHTALDIPLTKSAVLLLMRCIEMMSTIQISLQRSSPRISKRLASFAFDTISSWVVDLSGFHYKSKASESLVPALGRMAKTERGFLAFEGSLLVHLLDPKAYNKDFSVAAVAKDGKVVPPYQNWSQSLLRMFARRSDGPETNVTIPASELLPLVETLCKSLSFYSFCGRFLSWSCSTGFFYHSARDFCPVYWEMLRDRPQLSRRVPYVFAALKHADVIWECASEALSHPTDSSLVATAQRTVSIDDLLPAIAGNNEAVEAVHADAIAVHQIFDILLRDSPALYARLLFRKDVMCDFESTVADFLSKGIENDLRLHTHAVVLGQQHAPLAVPHRDFSRWVRLPPFGTFGKLNFELSKAQGGWALTKVQCAAIPDVYHLAARISAYLTVTFYRLTALCPHDWATYEEMRVLAKDKYGLSLPSPFLPGATLDQGLDVLEITRNIHVFVASYAYNMNTQSFLQRPHKTQAKYLHSVQIAHIANSVRTHGAGMMNTAVNFVYRFLAKRFFALSQFLYDDHIKSPLVKEQRAWQQSLIDARSKTVSSSSSLSFSVSRAEKLLKHIRKLGPYMEKFRDLITEIGNAIGYVRMVRSGGQHALAEPVEFLRSTSFFKESSEQGSRSELDVNLVEDSRELSDSTQKAASILELMLKDVVSKFSGGSTDYFGLLTGVFRAELSKDDHAHCKFFSMICPALSLSFCESMVAAKDRLMKTATASKYAAWNQQSVEGFSEDGFALGVAFVLRVLDLDQSFDSLHWFDAFSQHADSLETQLNQSLSASSNVSAAVDPVSPSLSSEDEAQTQRMALARIRSMKRECDLLRWTFLGARVLFFPKEEQSGLSPNVHTGARSTDDPSTPSPA
eukprot:ANDGO_07502.mRNA.1 WASH complex subunit 7 homolog